MLMSEVLLGSSIRQIRTPCEGLLWRTAIDRKGANQPIAAGSIRPIADLLVCREFYFVLAILVF
jgi:hypothetical protein